MSPSIICKTRQALYDEIAAVGTSTVTAASARLWSTPSPNRVAPFATIIKEDSHTRRAGVMHRDPYNINTAPWLHHSPRSASIARRGTSA
jgi:hypothetical protein